MKRGRKQQQNDNSTMDSTSAIIVEDLGSSKRKKRSTSKADHQTILQLLINQPHVNHPQQMVNNAQDDVLRNLPPPQITQLTLT